MLSAVIARITAEQLPAGELFRERAREQQIAALEADVRAIFETELPAQYGEFLRAVGRPLGQVWSVPASWHLHVA